MNLFPNNSPFNQDALSPPSPARVAKLVLDHEQLERENARFAQMLRSAAKEDAIHALRRVETDLRLSDQDRLADDLDAAISQVIGI